MDIKLYLSSIQCFIFTDIQSKVKSLTLCSNCEDNSKLLQIIKCAISTVEMLWHKLNFVILDKEL